MRNQPIPACEGSAGIRHSYAGDDFSVEAGHSAKAKPDLPERRDWSSDPWALHRAARLQERNAHGPCNGKLNPEEEGCTGRFCWLIYFACLLCSPCKEVSGEMGWTQRMHTVGNSIGDDAEQELGWL